MKKEDLQRLVQLSSDEDFEWFNSLNAALGYPVVGIELLAKGIKVITAMRQEARSKALEDAAVLAETFSLSAAKSIRTIKESS